MADAMALLFGSTKHMIIALIMLAIFFLVIISQAGQIEKIVSHVFGWIKVG